MRVFIGIELPQHIREACVAMMRGLESCVQGRWALESNLHLTLAFIGEAEPAQTNAIAAVMHAASQRFSPPRIALAGAGVFEKKRGSILYARAACEPDLSLMHDFLISALRDAGLPVDPGPFAAHITLARKAEVKGDVTNLPAQEAAFVPAHLTLFESARDAHNVLRYTPIIRCLWENGAKNVEV